MHKLDFNILQLPIEFNVSFKMFYEKVANIYKLFNVLH